MCAGSYRSVLGPIGRKILPGSVRKVMRSAVNRARERQERRRLARMRKKVWKRKPGSQVRFLRYTVRINDGPNFYMLYEDIFGGRMKE